MLDQAMFSKLLKELTEKAKYNLTIKAFANLVKLKRITELYKIILINIMYTAGLMMGQKVNKTIYYKLSF